MLQAYATIKILERKNIVYEIIRCRRRKSVINYIKCIPLVFNPLFCNEIIYRIHGLLKNLFVKQNKKRNVMLSKFWKDNFKYLSPEFCNYKELSLYSKKYKACLVGSDQLWRPDGLPENIYDLMFANDDIIKISYATSFGVSEIPLMMRNRTAKFLKRFDFLGVRENWGKKIIRDLIRIEPNVVLDPTLLFDKNDWDIFFPEEKIYNEPYIFAYLLGPNQEYRRLTKL
jgi:hypothetical protein